LLDKVWDLHAVRELPNGQTQLFIGLHLIHEVTSPQAFQMIREKGLKVAFPERTFATADHIIPTEESGASVCGRFGGRDDGRPGKELPGVRR
jgi:3-isopropylmalate/(R)-2-methylmalate dehydratase large subunit